MNIHNFRCRDCANRFEGPVSGSSRASCPFCLSANTEQVIFTATHATEKNRLDSHSGSKTKRCEGCIGSHCVSCH